MLRGAPRGGQAAPSRPYPRSGAERATEKLLPFSPSWEKGLGG
jgi:hypothetical protein